MQRDHMFRVVGLRMNGDRVVIAKDIDRQSAEQIEYLMTPDSDFAELFVEAEDDGETPNVACGTSASDESATAELTHRR
jgi:hypothetical protein